MAGATLGQIAYYLTKQGREYNQIAEGLIAVEAALLNGGKLAITIALQENGEYLELAAPQLLQGVEETVNQTALFQTMLTISWETKLLRWQYANGEVLGAIGFPLERASLREPLSEVRFNDALNGFIALMNYIIPRLEAALETGECLGLGEKHLQLRETVPLESVDSLLELSDRLQRGAA